MPNFLRHLNKQKTYGAIDLGSNAVRALIARKSGDELKLIQSVRIPLRLGEDVFSTGSISPDKLDASERAFIEIFYSFISYGVTEVRAVATSAMRDSTNGKALVDRIYKSTGIELEIISGKEEAELVHLAVKSQLDFKDGNAILMDIGGGSTELTLVKSKKIIAIKSFNVGTVRLLHYKNQLELEKRIDSELTLMMQFIHKHLNEDTPDFFVGTGGNLRRIGKIRKKTLGRPTSQLATYSEISHMEEKILSMSYIERVRRLELTENQADVILPATMLTHKIMQKLKVHEIRLPKVGLKEGVLLSIQEDLPKKIILSE